MNENTTIANLTEENLKAMTIEERLDALNNTSSKDLAYKIQTGLESDLKAENEENVKLAVETFAHEAARDVDNFFACFIKAPYAPVRKLKQDKDSGEWSIVPAQKRISFTQVDHKYGEENKGQTIANTKYYVGMIARFTNNLYRAKAGELSEGVGKEQAIVRVQYNGTDEQKEYDFSGCSIGKLAEQLDAIVKTIMPEGKEIKTVRADVRYIMTAFATAKEGKVKTMNEQRVTLAIFDALRVRMESKAYVIESSAKCHKSKVSDRKPSDEEKSSRIPDRPESETSNNPKTEKKAA